MPSLTANGLRRLLTFALVIDWLGFLWASDPTSRLLQILRIVWLVIVPWAVLLLLQPLPQHRTARQIGGLLVASLCIFTIISTFYTTRNTSDFMTTMIGVVMVQTLSGGPIMICIEDEEAASAIGRGVEEALVREVIHPATPPNSPTDYANSRLPEYEMV